MKKNIVLAVIATAAMALSLVGCGVKVTNISLPDAATLERGESITLPVNFGTEDAPAETPVIATGESATAETAAQDEKIAKAAEKLTLAWTSSDESVATVDETGTVTAVAVGEAEITATVKDTEMQGVCERVKGSRYSGCQTQRYGRSRNRSEMRTERCVQHFV